MDTSLIDSRCSFAVISSLQIVTSTPIYRAIIITISSLETDELLTSSLTLASNFSSSSAMSLTMKVCSGMLCRGVDTSEADSRFEANNSMQLFKIPHPQNKGYWNRY